MDKETVRSKFLERYKEILSSITESIEGNKKRAWDSPGANVSHSDTNKFSLSNLALAQSRQLGDLREVISSLGRLQANSQDKVYLGAVFELTDILTKKRKMYYLVTSSGGEEITIDGVKVVSISVAAPLAQACLGKEVGDEISINQMHCEISDVH